MNKIDRELPIKHISEQIRAYLTGELVAEIRLMVLPTLVVLLAYVVLDRILHQISFLPESHYFGSSISWALIENLVSKPLLAGGLVLLIVVLCWLKMAVWQAWRASGFDKGLHFFLTFVAFLLAWYFSTYDYNAYYDQAHIWDRLLLLILVPLIFYRPVFILPFLMLVLAIMLQFKYPLGNYSGAQQYVLIKLLMLAFCTWVVAVVSKRNLSQVFLLLGLCLIASSYWSAGWGKFQLGWHADDAISLLFQNTHANGWWLHLTDDQVADVTRRLAFFDAPLRIYTLVLEWLVLFLLWRRVTTLGFLGAWVLFHLGIFGYSGIFFWQWILIELALFAVLWYRPREQWFSVTAFFMSIVIIGGSPYWFKPNQLAWLDTAGTYTYRFSAELSDGRTVDLPPDFFAPYDYQFSLGGFQQLVQAPRLPISWGATGSRLVAEELNSAGAPQQFFDIENRIGREVYSEDGAANFYQFVARFADSANIRGSKTTALSMFASPRQIWTFADEPWQPGQRLVAVNVSEVTSFYDGQRYQEIREILLKRIPVPR